MNKFTTETLAQLNKGQLRELCRDNGIGYNGMNNDGMREALLLVPGSEVVVEVTSDTVVSTELQTAPLPTDVAIVVVQPDAKPLVLGTVTVEPAREPRVLPTLAVLPNTDMPVAKPAKERKIQANRPEQNGVKRPSAGTKCAQIWDWCDEVHNAGDKVTAKELKSALPALDATTCTVQFYRWRKFMGIQGRQ